MTTQRDDATVRRYRAASAALDERPAPATRAAILAAAARQVEARPQAAAAQRAGSGRRWPLAAAAAVLLSTLGVMMATRTQQEMPTFTAPAGQAPERVATPAAPAGTADSAARTSGLPAPVPSPAVGAAQAPSSTADAAHPGSAPPLKKSAPLPAPAKQVEAKEEMAAAIGRAGEPNEAAVRAKRNEEPSPEQVRERADGSAESRRAFPAAPAAAAPDAPPAIAPAPPSAMMDTAGSGVVAAPAAKPEGGRAEASPRASAPAGMLQGSTRQQNAARDVDRSAAEWLDRIVRLRAEGRHADADDELKRFRERYPDVQVPPAALPPAGTR
jgi:hypothetical protein